MSLLTKNSFRLIRNGFLKHFGQSRRTIAMDRDNYLRDAKYPSFLLYVLFGLGMAGTIHQYYRAKRIYAETVIHAKPFAERERQPDLYLLDYHKREW